MRRTILYYPTIDIPDGSWLRNAILYWDEVSSIVPTTDLLSADLVYLMQEKEYRPIHPDTLMESDYYYEFEQECLEKMQRHVHKVEQTGDSINRIHRDKFFPERRNSVNRIHRHKFGEPSAIFRDKMTSNIIDFLKEYNQVLMEDSEWIYIENDLTNIYMSILAKYVALSDVNYTVIGTDNIQKSNFGYPVKYASKFPFGHKKPFITNHIRNVLPTPTADTPYEKIINFKREYRDDLLKFRNNINQVESNLSKADTEQEIKEIIIDFREKLELGATEIIEMLEGSNIQFILSSLKSVINIKSPTLVGALVGTFIPGVPIAVTILGTAASASIETALNYINIKKATVDKLSDKGFLYLYHARRAGIVAE